MRIVNNRTSRAVSPKPAAPQPIIKEDKKVEVKKPKQIKPVLQEVPITAEDQAFLDELFAKKEK